MEEIPGSFRLHHGGSWRGQGGGKRHGAGWQDGDEYRHGTGRRRAEQQRRNNEELEKEGREEEEAGEEVERQLTVWGQPKCFEVLLCVGCVRTSNGCCLSACVGRYSLLQTWFARPASRRKAKLHQEVSVVSRSGFLGWAQRTSYAYVD